MEYYGNGSSEIVYDIYTVEGSRKNLADFGFERYNEINYVLPGYEKIPNFMNSDTHWSQNQTLYRYREVGGTWSQYWRVDTGQYDTAYITGGKMGRVFHADKEYEIDCVNVTYNVNEKKIYWPLDERLLQNGTGWKEAGFTFADWDYEKCLTAEQKMFECYQEYYVPTTEMYIKPYPDSERWQTDIRQTIPERAQSAGTETSPIKVDGNSNGDSRKWFSVNMDPSAFCLHAHQGAFDLIIEKKNAAGAWERIADQTENGMQSTEHWKATANNPEITAGYAYGAKGAYRLKSFINGIQWVKPSGNMFEPDYINDGNVEKMDLYDEATGKGMIYIEFE